MPELYLVDQVVCGVFGTQIKCNIHRRHLLVDLFSPVNVDDWTPFSSLVVVGKNSSLLQFVLLIGLMGQFVT